MSDAMPDAAKVFLTTKLDIKYMKPGIEWYPRVDVQLAWLQEFALSVTQSQAATIAEQEKTIERLTGELNQECGDYKELLDDSAVMAKDNIQLRVDVERYRKAFEKYSSSLPDRFRMDCEYTEDLPELCRAHNYEQCPVPILKALSNNAGGEGE